MLQIPSQCGYLNMIPPEELVQVLLLQSVSSYSEVPAGSGRGIYQDQGAGLGEGGKPLFTCNNLRPGSPVLPGPCFLYKLISSLLFWPLGEEEAVSSSPGEEVAVWLSGWVCAPITLALPFCYLC